MDRKKQFEIADQICEKLDGYSDLVVGKFALIVPLFMGMSQGEIDAVCEANALLAGEITLPERQTITDIVLGQRPLLMQKIRQSSR